VRIELAQCTIRSWRLEDAPSLAAHANNRNVWLTLRDRMPHPYTLAHAEAYVRDRIEQPHRLMFCIDVDGEAVGGIGVHPGDDVNRLTAELGYWLAEPFWGRGIMSAAVAAMVRYAFEHQALERIEAYVYASNPASARVLEKCGFTYEGRLRRNVIKDGAMLDSLLYALLRCELPASNRVAEQP
jgi:RimJ/RimL family protein N-acetyltransferase